MFFLSTASDFAGFVHMYQLMPYTTVPVFDRKYFESPYDNQSHLPDNQCGVRLGCLKCRSLTVQIYMPSEKGSRPPSCRHDWIDQVIRKMHRA